MLLFDENLFDTTRVNNLILPVETGDKILGYVYCSMPVYNQAYMLSIMYDRDRYQLESFLNISNRSNEDLVTLFVQDMPEPINMLGVFLYFVSPTVEISPDLKSLCIILNEMSKSMNFSSYVEVPEEARISLKLNNAFFIGAEDNYREDLLSLRNRVERIKELDSIAILKMEELDRVGLFVNKVIEKFGQINYFTSDSKIEGTQDKSSFEDESLVSSEFDPNISFEENFNSMFEDAFDNVMKNAEKEKEKEEENKLQQEKEKLASISMRSGEFTGIDRSDVVEQDEARKVLNLIEEAAGEEEDE